MKELVPSASSQEAGVVDLVKRLRVSICRDNRSDLRHILPVYERLLSPREETNISVHHGLLEIRSKLLSCGEDFDVLDAVDRMDCVVERCMEIDELQRKQQSAQIPIEEVMQLLVALAGGDDGEAFVLEDPAQATYKNLNLNADASKKRVGDRIRTKDVGLLQRSRALFNRAPVPLEASKLFSPDLFNAFGNGIPSQHLSLWCPNTEVPVEDGAFLNMMPFKQPNRFIALPTGCPAHSNLDSRVQISNSASGRQHERAVKPMKPQESGSRLFASKDVFFYDATREVHCGGWRQSPDWREGSSITENSSWGSEDSFDTTEPWAAQTYAWEELGSRLNLPVDHCKPPVREDKRSLRDLVIPLDFSCTNNGGDTPLEIHEADLIEDSLRALNGVDSAIFRRDCHAAKFKLPEKRGLKLRNSTISTTKSVLEVFRKAGTVIVRLEFLSIYYSQDSARGGRTLQAMGDALQVYLSMHRTFVRNIAQEYQETTLSEVDQEEDEAVSVAKLVSKTRKLCRVLEALGHVFGCEEGVDFWPLLLQGTFPRGVALLNHLHRHVLALRVEDAAGRMQELMTWFLVKSCSPMLAVLSDLIASGRVQESTDPFDEFEVTIWSRVLLAKATAGGGDGLFSEELSSHASEMLPEFLIDVTDVIVHLSQVQALLRSVNAMKSTQSLVKMHSLSMILHGNEAVEHAELWKATVDAATPSMEKRPDTEIDTNACLLGALRSSTEASSLDSVLVQAEAKRSSQLHQRNLLDQQVLDNQQRKRQAELEEKFDDARRVAEAEQAQVDEEAYGREALLEKYAVLMDGAEERHDYMKWRRDRALRLSTAKVHLQQMYAKDQAAWTTDKETEKSDTNTGAVDEVVSVIEDGVPVCEEGQAMVDIEVLSTSTLTPEWKTSVKVNAEAENRTFLSTDDGTWRASVKVNTEAGNRTSLSIDDGTWRASVKVNKEAGNRCSGNATTTDTAHRTSVRVLNEPGGSSAEMYKVLYDGSNGIPTQPEETSAMKTDDDDASGTFDVEMADVNSDLDRSDPQDDAPLNEFLLQASEEEDVEMQNSTLNREETRNELDDNAPVYARIFTEPERSSRVSLPPVHPFFSWDVPEEDVEVLTHALTETRSEADLTSFASIVDCCVQVPVRLVANKLEDVAVNWFRNTMEIVEHLRWLRKLMLMSEGLCMDIFARDFLLGVNSTTRVNWGCEGRLSSALTLAMIEGSVAVDAIAKNFHYKSTAILSQVLGSRTMTAAIPSLLSEIELVYDVVWPLGLVITSQSLVHYQHMHRFLLYVRLTSLEMREAWSMLRTIRRQGHLFSNLERRSGGVIYKMQAFLRAFNETFATKVLMAAWTELEDAIVKTTTLKQLQKCHEEYVAIAIRCCFLDVSSVSVHAAFLNTLTAAWSLTAFLRSLERQVTGRTSEATRLHAICVDYDVALQMLVSSLQKVNYDAERKTREFSECLLLRLNFNDFYSTDDVLTATGE